MINSQGTRDLPNPATIKKEIVTLLMTWNWGVRKRAHGSKSTRRMPLSTVLTVFLEEWLTIHPCGQFFIASAKEVPLSKKRGQPTGHLWNDRPVRSRKDWLASPSGPGQG